MLDEKAGVADRDCDDGDPNDVDHDGEDGLRQGCATKLGGGGRPPPPPPTTGFLDSQSALVSMYR